MPFDPHHQLTLNPLSKMAIVIDSQTPVIAKGYILDPTLHNAFPIDGPKLLPAPLLTATHRSLDLG